MVTASKMTDLMKNSTDEAFVGIYESFKEHLIFYVILSFP
jgi:hypothetical protein